MTQMCTDLAPPPPRTRPMEVPVRNRARREKSDMRSGSDWNNLLYTWSCNHTQPTHTDRGQGTTLQTLGTHTCVCVCVKCIPLMFFFWFIGIQNWAILICNTVDWLIFNEELFNSGWLNDALVIWTYCLGLIDYLGLVTQICVWLSNLVSMMIDTFCLIISKSKAVNWYCL